MDLIEKSIVREQMEELVFFIQYIIDKIVETDD